MKTIIALRGKGNSGKSETIRILHNLLDNNDYELVRTNLENNTGDFVSIFRKNKIFIGITSSGDLYDYVHDRLEELINDGCKICVCACRSYDRVPPGTNAAVTEFPGYTPQFVEKTYDDSENTQEETNQNDANILFEVIHSLLQ